MKSFKISALSLALLLPVATFAAEAPTAKKACAICTKVGEMVTSVRAQLPVMPSKEQAKEAITNAPKAAVEFAKAHPYKATAIVAATAAVAYAVYKVFTAKKAKNTKVVVVK